MSEASEQISSVQRSPGERLLSFFNGFVLYHIGHIQFLFFSEARTFSIPLEVGKKAITSDIMKAKLLH